MAGIFRLKNKNQKCADEDYQIKLPDHILKNGLEGDPLLKIGYLNSRHYAIGDGLTDDTENLKKAISDAQQASLILYLSPGTYLISDTLDLEHNRPDEDPFHQI
jgi:hypothetical protein